MASLKNHARQASMKRSLRGFQDRLSLSISIATAAVAALFFLIFAFLIQSLAQSRARLASLQFDRAVENYVTSLESQVALIAGNAEFRTFVRSGSVTRALNRSKILELTAALVREEIVGADVYSEQSLLVDYGTRTNSALTFSVCYVGERLNAEYGNCIASIRIYFDPSMLLENISRDSRSRRICEGCGRMLRSWGFSSTRLKYAEPSTVSVDLAPLPDDAKVIEVICVLLLCLIAGLGLWIRRQITNAVSREIVGPLNSLISAMEDGSSHILSVDDSLTEFVRIQTSHSRSATIAQMIQSISHDLRVPLGVFERFIQTPDHLIPSMKSEVREVFHRMNAMIESLRKPEEDSVVTRKQSTLNFSIGHTGLIHRAQEKNVIFTIPSEDISDAWIDTMKVDRAWINLASNAIDAARSYVRVEVEKKDRHLFIRVIDDGLGVPNEILPNLFNRGVTYGKNDGTGLGLAYVRQVVQGHGGTISYQRCEDTTVFECYIPDAFVLTNKIHDLEERSIKENMHKVISICLGQASKNICQCLAKDFNDINFVADYLDDAEIVVTSSGSIAGRALEDGKILIDIDANNPQDKILKKIRIRLGLKKVGE